MTLQGYWPSGVPYSRVTGLEAAGGGWRTKGGLRPGDQGTLLSGLASLITTLD